MVTPFAVNPNKTSPANKALSSVGIEGLPFINRTTVSSRFHFEIGRAFLTGAGWLTLLRFSGSCNAPCDKETS